MSLGDSLGALRERRFRLLFTGQLISLLGDSFTTIALTWAVLELTGSATDLGIVMAAHVIPLVVFLLVGGVFSDRLSRRHVMIAADLTRLAAQGCTAALVLTHTATVGELVALQAVSGIATAFFNPASTGLVPHTISAERLQQANALRGISMSAAGLVGLVAGGTVVALVGPGWALAFDAGTFGASVYFLVQLRLPAQIALPAQSFLGDLHEGWHEFVARTWLWTIVIVAALGNALNSIFIVLCAVVAKRYLGGAWAYTTILLGFGIGSLLGGVAALRLNPRRPLFVGMSLLATLGVPVVLLALHASAFVVAAGGVLSGGANLVFNALWETSLQRHVPPAVLSRVSAYDWFGSLAFAPLGLIVAGPAADAFGLSSTLWAVAAGSVAVVVLGLLPRSVRELTSAIPADVRPLSAPPLAATDAP